MRTLGAKDKKKRKSRRNPNKKYVRRKGKFVPYVSKRQRGDPIKIWFWEERPMSPEGIKHWNKNLRLTIRKVVYRPYIRADVDPYRISKSENIADTAMTIIGHEGIFIMMGFSRGKNKYRVKPVKLCRIQIKSTSEGLRASVSETWRLSRYWFWRGG